MSQDIVPDTQVKGLSAKQIDYARELLIRQMQGSLSPDELKTLTELEAKDPQKIIALELRLIKSHPEFNTEGEYVQNQQRNLALQVQMERVKSQTKVDMSKKDSLDINTINRLMKMSALNQPQDGKQFGLGGTQNIRGDLKPENKNVTEVLDFD